MTELKCPICNKPMKQATYDYDKKDNDDTLYMSVMPCDCVCNFAASKAVWEVLADTKKKLDIAVDVLKRIDDIYKLNGVGTQEGIFMGEYAHKALLAILSPEEVQMRTLEQISQKE